MNLKKAPISTLPNHHGEYMISSLSSHSSSSSSLGSNCSGGANSSPTVKRSGQATSARQSSSLTNAQTVNSTPIGTRPRAINTLRAAATTVIAGNRLQQLIAFKPLKPGQTPPQHAEVSAQAVKALKMELDRLKGISGRDLTAEEIDKSEKMIKSMIGHISKTIDGDDSKKATCLNEMLTTLIDTFSRTPEGSGKLLTALSPILNNPKFADSLTLKQHKKIAGLIDNTLVLHGKNASLVRDIFLPLLEKNEPEIKLYRDVLGKNLLTILSNPAQHEDKTKIGREVTLSELLDRPGFLASLTSKQHAKLAALFESRIKASLTTVNDAQTETTNAQTNKTRAIYIALASKLFSNGHFSSLPASDRKVWVNSMNKGVGDLYHDSLCVKKDAAKTEQLLRDSVTPFQNVSNDEKTLLQTETETSLFNQLVTLKNSLTTHKNTLTNRWYAGITDNETRQLNKMIRRLEKYEEQAKDKNNDVMPPQQDVQQQEKVISEANEEIQQSNRQWTGMTTFIGGDDDSTDDSQSVRSKITNPDIGEDDARTEENPENIDENWFPTNFADADDAPEIPPSDSSKHSDNPISEHSDRAMTTDDDARQMQPRTLHSINKQIDSDDEYPFDEMEVDGAKEAKEAKANKAEPFDEPAEEQVEQPLTTALLETHNKKEGSVKSNSTNNKERSENGSVSSSSVTSNLSWPDNWKAGMGEF